VNSLFNELISKLISLEKDISIDIINNFYEIFNSIYFYKHIFDSFLSILNNKKIKNQNEFNNFYNLVIYINDLDSFLDNSDSNINNEEELNELKGKYQNIIINLINEKLIPLSLIKEFMKILNKKIVQNVVNPIIFSDYLLNKTNEIKIKSINDFDIQIFGLSSLFVLLTKYNLDYDKYYELLYKLISQKFNDITIFDSKYKNRILKLLELSLTSEQIPYIVICSFIKKLLRISLFSKVEIIYSLLSLVMKIIQLHPRTLNLIMDNKSKKILKKILKIILYF
jgi:U3 small nucleolar RNA-associated protein 19